MSLITPDFGLVFWMVLIFGVVFFLLAKFGFPIISKSVQERSEYIEKSLRAAEQARLSLEETARQQQSMLDEARAEQGRMIHEAARTKEAIVAQAREQAQAESAKIVSRARAEIAAEKERAMQELRSSVSALSVAVAEKIMRKELEQTPEQISLLDRLADEASHSPMS